MKERELHDAIARALVDDGKLIEAGWRGLRAVAIAPDAPADQLSEMRMAFFAGAQHLYGSIMGMLDPGADPTTNDMRRFEQIDWELRAFAKELQLRVARPGGAG